MKKVVLTFGLIGGLIIAGLVWVTAILVERRAIGFERLEVVGYASMLIALSMVFFGIKSYRDNYSGGQLRFWKGVQVGVLISLIAGVLYWGGATSYGVANPGFDERFMKQFSDLKVGKLQEQGASEDQIESAKAEVEMMAGLFKNPVLFFLICMVEIMPVGIIVTLISAGLLRKKELLPAAEQV
ncbi:MAG: DUF4199 domain-containing protein [Chloracidobacterium sp.]|nr:DUF4199 domain-containing protein [Chloracidobacterium sp.]